MNKTLLERQPNNKRIATTESLQKRFFNGSKNHVMEIEKLICHHSATKEHINFGYTILFSIIFISLAIRRKECPAHLYISLILMDLLYLPAGNMFS